MKIAVLALQGDFAEHAEAAERLGIETLLLRNKRDLLADFDAVILPGGESTVQSKLLHELDMFDTLREMILSGKPVMATCAGLILLADRIAEDTARHLATLDVTVKRNAYGRQLGSFYIEESFAGSDHVVPMSFIRAPAIECVGGKVEILASFDGKPTAVRQGNQLGMTFHPELQHESTILEYFIEKVIKGRQ